MTGWDAAWLAEHQRKLVAYRGGPVESVIARPDRLTFSLPNPTLTLNKMLHMHPMVRSKYAKTLSSERYYVADTPIISIPTNSVGVV